MYSSSLKNMKLLMIPFLVTENQGNGWITTITGQYWYLCINAGNQSYSLTDCQIADGCRVFSEA